MDIIRPHKTTSEKMKTLGYNDPKILGFKEDGTEIVLATFGSAGNVGYNRAIQNDITRNIDNYRANVMRLREKLKAKKSTN